MGEDSGQICVLCVDDEPGLAELTATYIERADNQFSTSAAESAQEGIDFLAENPVDCIVSDYNMPGMDGLAFLQAIRATHPDLPFILFTGRGSEEIASDAISAGVSDYMQKESGNEQYAMLGQRIRNVVDRYRSHAQKQEVETRAETILEASPDAIVVSVDNEFVYANTAAVELYNVSDKADLHGRQVLEFIHPDYRDDVGNQFKAVESGEKPADHIPRTLLTLEGEEFPVEVTARGVMWEGQPGVVGIVRDLASKDEYMRQQERYEATFQSAFDAMVVADEEGRYIDANQSACELFGLKKEELLGRSIEEFARDDYDFETEWERFQQSKRERGTFPLVRADGEQRTVEYAASAEIIEGQHLSILRDVTDRSEREDRLQQTTARLDALYENTPDMLDVLDTDGRLLDVNNRFCSELGYTEEELLGRPIWDIDVQASEDDVDTLFADFELDERRKFEGAYKRKDGSTFPVEVHLLRLNITGTDRFLAISRDITEQKAYERSLERQNEMLDEFAGLVSHDLRNPLNVAEGNLKLAREDCDSEHLDAIEKAHDRMDALIENMLELARLGQQVNETEPIDLVDFAEVCWQNVETGEATLVSRDAPSIQGDRSRVQQLLENLIRNAVEHGGEEVTITIGEVDGGFYIEDDGVGIPEDNLAEIFESGYSTSDEGTGFGLSIVKQIADAHGWTVEPSTGADGGARFQFTGVHYG